MKKFRIALLLYMAFDLFILGNTAGLLPLTPMMAAQTSVNVPNYPPIRATPDCLIQGTFIATGTSTVYDNRGNGCTTWHLVYSNTGYSALNIALQSADDAGGTPSAFANWGTSGGTLAPGTTLPLTATTSAQATGYKYRPFIQINLSSATGSGRVWYMAYGYRPGNSDSSGTGPTGAATTTSGTASAVTQPGYPMICDTATSGTVTAGQAQMVRCGIEGVLAIGHGTNGQDAMSNTEAWPRTEASFGGLPSHGYIFNGASWDRSVYCPNTGKVNALAAATVALVAPVAGKKARICSFQVSNNNATATTLKVIEGTGATCGTGTTDLTALMNIGATTTTPFNANISATSPWTTNTVADGACAVSSAASSLEITYTWEQH